MYTRISDLGQTTRCCRLTERSVMFTFSLDVQHHADRLHDEAYDLRGMLRVTEWWGGGLLSVGGGGCYRVVGGCYRVVGGGVLLSVGGGGCYIVVGGRGVTELWGGVT